MKQYLTRYDNMSGQKNYRHQDHVSDAAKARSATRNMVKAVGAALISGVHTVVGIFEDPRNETVIRAYGDIHRDGYSSWEFAKGALWMAERKNRALNPHTFESVFGALGGDVQQPKKVRRALDWSGAAAVTTTIPANPSKATKCALVGDKRDDIEEAVAALQNLKIVYDKKQAADDIVEEVWNAVEDGAGLSVLLDMLESSKAARTYDRVPNRTQVPRHVAFARGAWEMASELLIADTGKRKRSDD